MEPRNAALAPSEAAAPQPEAPLDLGAMQTSRAVHEAVRLASGRTVVVRGDEDGERVVIRAPDGEMELTVKLTAEGPVLSLRAVALSLDASRLSIDVDRLSVKAREHIAVESLGGVEARVLGDQRTDVQGASRLEAGTVALHANRGDLRVEASEDVHVDGRAVRLNC
jgi:hypothetical protein